VVHAKKVILILVIAIIILILIVQNMDPVRTRLLFVNVTMPLAGLLFITLVAGLVMGIIVSLMLGKHSGKRNPDQ
jgi:uncharacterized integral membrane protein